MNKRYILKQKEGFKCKAFYPTSENETPDLEKYIEVSLETCIELNKRKLMWQNGALVNNPNYEELKKQRELDKKSKLTKETTYDKITKLKQKLAETDYRAIKYFEGYYTEEEYAPYKVERQAYRDEINRLEKELAQSDQTL